MTFMVILPAAARPCVTDKQLPDRGCLTFIAWVSVFSSRYDLSALIFISQLKTRTPASACPPFQWWTVPSMCYDTLGVRYEKREHKCREEGGRRKCRLFTHVEEESKVFLTIAVCGWCSLIILLLGQLPVHAGVVSQYYFSFLGRSRQRLEHTFRNAPNYYFPAVHNVHTKILSNTIWRAQQYV